MKKLWELIVKEEIHQDVVVTFFLVLFATVGGILISQYHWPEGAREVYYAHSGALYDMMCLVFTPICVAFFVGISELLWHLSSAGSSISTKGE